jgi:hypothetical protein
MERAKIKENPNFIKDFSNGAILNTNKAAIAKHELKMAEIQKRKQIDDEINNLKSEVSDIKNMLAQILTAVNREK